EIYIERRGVIEKTNKKFANDEQVRVLLDKVLAPLGRRIDESSPMVNARLERGHRVNAIIPPLSPDGPVVTIRAFSRNLLTLEEMLMAGSVDFEVYEFISWVVRLRKNIVVSGGTGSGKTTMLNAASCFIPRGERVITIEDSLELKFSPEVHVVRLEARPMNSEGAGEVTIRDLVKNALRMSPDRIIVGECRGGEALDMLQAMNTGHDGSMTTIHANSCEDVVERMTALVRYAVDLPLDAIISQLGSAFDFIFQVKRGKNGERFLSEISKVDFDREERKVRVTPIYKREEFKDSGAWHVDASIPEQALDACIANKKEVEEWLHNTASSLQ
ncbi:MAG: ATPase, T2SS/T4P/T4SS family, partial [Phoenicibacter congonensis]|nr:ATPase, T2SS/T4P/T4SS family [Phoenicibacter congonensis]